MKILFVDFGRENLGIEYLSSVLKQEGHKTDTLHDPGLFSSEDNVFYNPLLEKLFARKEKIINAVIHSNCQLVAFSVYTTTYKWSCDIAKAVKEKSDVKIVFGGIHPTLVPDKVIGNSFVDFLIRGEGEFPLLELVSALNDNSPCTGIKNLWYKKKDGTIIKNEVRPPIENLDILPLPDKGLFEKDVRFKDDYMIMTSRGCPYHCSYCCISYLNPLYINKHFRRRSVDSVIGELVVMQKKYSYKEVMFFDNTLFSNKKWLHNLCVRYREEIGVPFRCIGHVNFFDAQVGQLLKEAGCYCIDFGVQTFNEQIRREILNRCETNTQIKKVFTICDSLNLRYDVDLMFGLPGVSEEDYRLPLDFMKDHTYFNRLKCYYLSYFPNLPIVDKAKQMGLLDDKDIKKIENGDIGDWFHVDSIKDKTHKRWKENFQKIYKVYPLIPPFLRNIIIKQKLYRLFFLIPNIIIVFLQLLIGIVKKDYRFKIYLKNYPFQLKKCLLNKSNGFK